MIIIPTIAICVLLPLLYYYLISRPRAYKRMPFLLQEEDNACIAKAEDETASVKKKLEHQCSEAEMFVNAYIDMHKPIALQKLYEERKSYFEERSDFHNSHILALWEENNKKLQKVKEEIENHKIDIAKTISLDLLERYTRLSKAYDELKKSKKIWQIEYSFVNSQNKSSAKTIVNLKECNLPPSQKFLFVGVSDLNIPTFTGSGGETIYIYPQAIVKVNSDTDFRILPVLAVSVKSEWTRFVEDIYTYPDDAEFIEHTWEYVNKNGQPDARYSYNPMKSVVRYGIFSISYGGVRLQFSNRKVVDEFANAYDLLRTPKVYEEYEYDSVNQDDALENGKSLPTTAVPKRIAPNNYRR